MKRFNYVSMIVMLISSLHTYNNKYAHDTQMILEAIIANNNDTITPTDETKSFDLIIPFFTNEKEEPYGKYWRGLKPYNTPNDNQKMHIACAYIGNHTYSQILESPVMLTEEQLTSNQKEYLGYFIDPVTIENIYLYGKKDIVNNDNDKDEEHLITTSESDENQQLPATVQEDNSSPE